MPSALASVPTLEQARKEIDRTEATRLLDQRSIEHPDLTTLEAQARLDLVSAIVTLERVDDLIASGKRSIHNFRERINVELSLEAYMRTLKNLVHAKQPGEK